MNVIEMEVERSLSDVDIRGKSGSVQSLSRSRGLIRLSPHDYEVAWRRLRLRGQTFHS